MGMFTQSSLHFWIDCLDILGIGSMCDGRIDGPIKLFVTNPDVT